MSKKTRFFIKVIGEATNAAIMDYLARTGDHQDGIAAQEIKVNGKAVQMIEVPSYDVIKALYESAKQVPYRFTVYVMPPGAKQAGLWQLHKYHKKRPAIALAVATP